MAFRPEWNEGRGGSSPFTGSSPAPATRIIIISCVAIFLLQYVLDLFAPPDPLAGLFGLSTTTAPFLVPFVSYMFLHDVLGVWHLVFNMLFLFFFGRELEMTLGGRRYLGIYFGAGILGGLLYVAISLWRGSSVPVIGASGGVFGILTYCACLYPNRRVILLIFPIKVWHLAAFYIGGNVLLSLQDLAGRYGGGVAWAAHLGGAGWGALAWWRQLDPTTFLSSLKTRMRQRTERRRKSDELDESREMDRILQKIHHEGLSSLTDKEKRFLDRVSRELKERR
ncbi:MAG: rhomboid family intramembrane serine protease [Planctomycetota bacterium]